MKNLNKLWDEKPLFLIMTAAALLRMLSVLFSKGFGMHDDHFLVIEAAQSWVDNFDYNNWLPSSSSTPSGHSWFYCNMHFVLFKLLQVFGIYNPEVKMYIVRFLHALLSLITVYTGYRISEHLSGKHVARMAGLLLAVLWFMPMLSVRNLVEVVCVPFLMLATWLLIKPLRISLWMNYALAGLIAGIAFSIRFQCILFIGGMGMVLLFQRNRKAFFAFSISAVFCMAAMQGIYDYILWGKPFAEFQAYMQYNIDNSRNYIMNKWYMYLVLIAGILIPPVSLFLFFGYFRSWRKHLMLFLPSFLFLAFHIYFPNKQERFIFPVIPFMVVLGCIGWYDFLKHSSFRQNRKKLLQYSWIFFWVLNTIPLLVVTVTYSKRSRVESMIYLSKKNDFKRLIVEDSNHEVFTMPPFFYLGKWYTDGYIQGITSTVSADSICRFLQNHPEKKPNYVFFMEAGNLEERVANFRKCFPKIHYETVIEPGFLDKLLFRLNPRNRNHSVFIYRIDDN